MNRFCAAKGCHTSGPAHDFVRCRICKQWFCKKHIDDGDGVNVMQSSSATWFEAICQSCKSSAVVDRASQAGTHKYVATKYISSASNGSMPKTVYQALVPIVCRGCQAEIPKGGLFVRAQRKKSDPPFKGRGRRPSYPYCRQCHPFRVYGVSEL